MSKLSHQVSLLLISLCLVLLVGSCDDECEERFDYLVPTFINNQLFVESSFGYTVLNGVPYPQGINVWYLGGPNEFYSMSRFTQNGQLVKFYWAVNFPPPFSVNSAPPLHALQIGEVINLHVFVQNRAFPDLDCVFGGAPPAAEAQLITTVVLENGEIVAQDPDLATLPSIPEGEIKAVKFPIEYVGAGNYEARFRVDVDLNNLERDTSNNFIRINTNF